MTVTYEEVAAKLDQIEAIIAAGWTQGAYYSRSGEHCLVGAIGQAIEGEDIGMPDLYRFLLNSELGITLGDLLVATTSEIEWVEPLGRVAVDELECTEALPARLSREGLFQYLELWNDAADRTKEQVIEAVRRARARAGS